MSELTSSSLYRGHMVMRSNSGFLQKSRRSVCILLAALPCTAIYASVVSSAETVGVTAESQVMRVQPDLPRLSDQVWFRLVHNRGATFGLDAYAKRIFVTRTGRYYVPVDEERAAIATLRKADTQKKKRVQGNFMSYLDVNKL